MHRLAALPNLDFDLSALVIARCPQATLNHPVSSAPPTSVCLRFLVYVFPLNVQLGKMHFLGLQLGSLKRCQVSLFSVSHCSLCRCTAVLYTSATLLDVLFLGATTCLLSTLVGTWSLVFTSGVAPSLLGAG